MDEYLYACQRIWKGYKAYAGGAGVIRKGWESTGVTQKSENLKYPLKPEEFAAIFYRRSESTLEHQAKTAWLDSVYASNFPDFFGAEVACNLPAHIWQSIVMLLCHDVGESETGDILDDGSAKHDNGTKDEIELIVFKDFVSAYSFIDRRELITLFKAFQKKDSYSGQAFFALDKLEAILTHMLLESCGLYGRISAKQNPSERDLKSVEITGSDLAADNWGFQAVSQFTDYPESIKKPIFTLLNVAACDVRGEEFSWLPTTP